MATKRVNKIAIGISDEGKTLQLIKVKRGKGIFQILAAKSFTVQKKLDSKDFGNQQYAQDKSDNSSIEITSEEDLSIIEEETSPAATNENNAIFMEILEMSKGKRSCIALSETEPQVFNNTFETDWGLKGKKLYDKIHEEIANLRESHQSREKDALATLTITGGRLVAFLREQNLDFFDSLNHVKKFSKVAVPTVSFVESAEISLTNLVINIFDPTESTYTLIVHVGVDYSRFIILEGREIFHISDMISIGASSPDILTTLNHRLIFLLDTLSNVTIDLIVLTGFAEKIGMFDFFENQFVSDGQFSDNLQVRRIDPDHFDHSVMENNRLDDLGPYAVALGAAIRALCPDRTEFYHIDLTPKSIKESQNRLMLSPIGWILLLIIPVILASTIVKIGHLKRELANIQSQLAPKQAQLEQFQALEQSIEGALATLSQYEGSYALVDSLTHGSNTWTTFWEKLNSSSQRIEDFWLTEITTENDIVTLRGYSIYRNRIPWLIKTLGDASLKAVEVQEIRGKTVYRFEIEAKAKIE